MVSSRRQPVIEALSVGVIKHPYCVQTIQLQCMFKYPSMVYLSVFLFAVIISVVVSHFVFLTRMQDLGLNVASPFCSLLSLFHVFCVTNAHADLPASNHLHMHIRISDTVNFPHIVRYPPSHMSNSVAPHFSCPFFILNQVYSWRKYPSNVTP